MNDEAVKAAEAMKQMTGVDPRLDVPHDNKNPDPLASSNPLSRTKQNGEDKPRRPFLSRPKEDHKKEKEAEDEKTGTVEDNSEPSFTSEPVSHYYDSKVELPQRTSHVIDRALDNLKVNYLQEGEIRRKSWLRPVFPFLSGLGIGIVSTKSVAGFFEGIGKSALITGLFSPVASLVRRITGENAFSQFARFANKAENNNLLTRLTHGGESRAVKNFFLKEDRDIRQLLRLKDQGAVLDRIHVGSRDRIDNLIASGVLAGMKAQMIAENGVQLSEADHDKLLRLQEAFQMSKTLMDAKIPKGGQQDIFINDVLPNLVKKKERLLWMKQTAGITGVGLLKSTAMVILGSAFNFTNINWLLNKAGAAGGRVWDMWTNVTQKVLTPAFTGAMMIPHNLGVWAKYYGYNASTWVAKALNQKIPYPSPDIEQFYDETYKNWVKSL